MRNQGFSPQVFSMGEPGWDKHEASPGFHTYVKLKSDTISLVGIRMIGENTTGNRSKAKHKIGYYNIEIHYVVPKERMANPKEYKATLKFITKGMFSKEVTGIEWSGKELSQMLANDLDVTEKLKGLLKPYEKLTIKPDPKRGTVHIILTTRLTTGYMQPGQRSDAELPSPPLFRSINRVAKHVKDYAS
jgi:hypothetical protein